MATHDYVIANGTGAAVRSDLNGALAAIVSQNSSATEPSPSYAYQRWADTTAGVMKMRNGANNAWISLYELDGTFLAGDISLSAGAAATPSLFFTGDTNTGIYSPGADQVGISTGGTARITVDGSGNVNIDSNTLYVDAANNRVGLGTGSPASVLDVASSNSGITLTNTGASNKQWRLGGSSAGSFVITETGVSDRLTINSSGNVGIGTSSPSNILHVSGTSGTPALFERTGSNGVFIGLKDGSGNVNYIGNTNGVFSIQTPGSSYSDKLVVTSTGLVGIGTTAPQKELQINATTPTIRLEENGGGSKPLELSVNSSAEAKVFAEQSGSQLLFGTVGTERARIDSSGNVNIGTTSSIYGARLTCASAAGVSASAFSTDTASEYGTILRNVATSGNNGFALFETEGTPVTRGSITYNRGGGVVAYNTTSDYRAKTLLGAVENPGETIDALKVYRGVMNGATVERPMLVAHEAQEVAPYCVTGEKDAKDDNGNPIYQQMDHQVLIPLLIAEIQQLRIRLSALEGA